MKKIKIIISLLLIVSILANSTTISFASNKNNETATKYKHYIFYSDSYLLKKEKNANKNIYKDILNTVSVIKTENIAGLKSTTYSTNGIKKHLKNCKKVSSVEKLGNNIYISYVTNANEQIILTYDKNGLIEQGIYDSTSDQATIIQGSNIITVNNFQKNSIVKLPENKRKEINDALIIGDYNKINNISGITTHQSGNSLIIDFDNNLKLNASSKKTNFIEPSKQFTPYKKKVINSKSYYCTTLKKNVTVKVKQTMNAYTKTKASYKSFLAGVSLTVIGLFISAPVTVAAKVVTAAGVVISSASQIKESIVVYKSASYDYWGAKEGYVYDVTNYKKDVKTFFNASKGQFNGGLNSKGKFTWIDFKPSSAFTKSTSTISSKAFYNYNAHITLRKYNSLYYPD